MFSLADIVTWDNAWKASLWILSILGTVGGVLGWLYSDALKARLTPHVESTLDFLERKAGRRLGRFLRRPPAMEAAPRTDLEPPPTWHDWTEGEIPALRIWASWAWGRDGALAEPRCLVCANRLAVSAAGGLASGDPSRTRIACPSGHFAEDREGTPGEFMDSLNREINRMRDQGEWSTPRPDRATARPPPI